jgi:hypothetical protein
LIATGLNASSSVIEHLCILDISTHPGPSPALVGRLCSLLGSTLVGRGYLLMTTRLRW